MGSPWFNGLEGISNSELGPYNAIENVSRFLDIIAGILE
jgi:hypothetical protein